MNSAGALAAEVVVAGAGVAGSALAFELAQRGVNVLLLERGPEGAAGASTVPAALINPHRGRSGRAKPLDLDGATAFWELIERLEACAGPSGAHPTGVLRLADNARQARTWQKLEGTHWLEAGEVPPEYHAPFGGMLVPMGGWLRGPELLGALVKGAQLGSARLLSGVELTGVRCAHTSPAAAPTSELLAHVRPAGSAGLHDDEADAASYSIACRALVVATGAQQPVNLPLPRLELVWGEARSLELGFTPALPLAGGVVAAFHDGVAYVTGGHRAAGSSAAPVEPDRTAELATDLGRALAWHVPGAESARVLAGWEGVRAKRPSGEPVVRRLAPGVHFMGAFGGRGFLRAALAASRLAEELAARLR